MTMVINSSVYDSYSTWLTHTKYKKCNKLHSILISLIDGMQFFQIFLATSSPERLWMTGEGFGAAVSGVVSAVVPGNYIARIPQAAVVVRAGFETPGVKLLPFPRPPHGQVVDGRVDARSWDDQIVASVVLEAPLLWGVLEHALEGVEAATSLRAELGTDASPGVHIIGTQYQCV